jgi:hypothetical protein
MSINLNKPSYVINTMTCEELAADAAQQAHDVEAAVDEGFCYYCGEVLDECTGYKCWIR